MMKMIKHILKTWNLKNPSLRGKTRKEKKEWLNNPKNHVWNIYGDLNSGDYRKRFHFMHYIFKYKILVPLIKLWKFIAGRRLITHIPYSVEDRNLCVFKRAWNKGMEDWKFKIYEQCYTPAQKRRRTMNFKLQHEMLDTMRDSVLSLVKYDTAYKNLFDCVMFNLWQEMHKEYEKDKKDHVDFLFWNSKIINDIRYFIMVNGMADKPDLIMEMFAKDNELKDVKFNLYAKRVK